MPCNFYTRLVSIIVLFKEIRVLNRSDSSGYICNRTTSPRERLEYYTPCKCHARYVTINRYYDDTGDLCEVEIHGEYTIDTIFKTCFYAFDL